jgi:hypothetical protein
MWHKERLLNLIAQQLPPNYTKIAWIDADVLFPNPQWYQRASALLESYKIVQLFERVSQLDNGGTEVRKVLGLASHIARGGLAPFRFESSQTWPGLAWAARRDLLATHGLLDVMIVGGADTYMSLAAYGTIDEPQELHVKRLAPKLRKAWQSWAMPFFTDIRGKVGYLPITIAQLGHGQAKDRGYVERMEILVRNDFDPVNDIAPESSGVWEWSSQKPLLHAEVISYFRRRHEDLLSKNLPERNLAGNPEWS